MKLRPIFPADEAQMLDILTSDLVKQTYMLPDFADREAALPLFRRLVAQSEDPGRFVRAIDLDGKLVGFLNDVEVSGASIEVGYAVHPDHWGKGCATAGLKLAIAELFRRGFREVVAGAFEGNPASLRVMEKAGMTRIPKIDEIEYRGSVHQCFYCSIQA